MKTDVSELAAVQAAEAAVAKATRPPLTLKTRHLYTEQEIFDYVVPRIIAQGRAAVTHEGRPVLRNAQGHRCAVGMLVEDAAVDGVWTLALNPREILAALMHAHDMHAALTPLGFVATFRQQVAHVATNRGLDPIAAWR